jgi:hypothetical protein
MQALVRAGQDVKFRGEYAPLPSCRVSQFLAASFARNRRFRDFLKFATFDGCASGVRDGDCSESSRSTLSLTVTQNEHLVDPRGEPAVLRFGYRLGTGVPPWGPPPHPGPAVHSNGWTALHWAAYCGNRRIVRSLVDANADVNAKTRDGCGCAVCARGESAECAGRVPAARRPCRLTPLHKAAYNRHSACVAELLLRGADGAVQNQNG